MTKPARFSQADLRRAIKVVTGEGLPVAMAEITPDGTIRILTGGNDAANDSINPLDRILHG